MAREIRITLGQLPGGLAEGPGQAQNRRPGRPGAAIGRRPISPRLAALGLKLEVLDKASQRLIRQIAAAGNRRFAGPGSGRQLRSRGGRGAGFSSAQGCGPGSNWSRRRLSPRKLAWAGGARARLFCAWRALLASSNGKLSLAIEMERMEPNVDELTADQDQIKNSPRGMTSRCATCHPCANWRRRSRDDGGISAKKVEIHDVSGVTCSGVARDNASFSRLMPNWAMTRTNISNLHAEIHGQKPMDFTVNFQWEGGQANGN